MLLAVVLSIIAVMGYSALTGRSCVPPPPPKEKGPQDAAGDPAKGAQPAKGTPPAGAPAKGVTPPAKAAAPNGQPPVVAQPPAIPADHPQRGVPASSAELNSDELDVTFTSQGGAIESVRQRHVFESDGKTAFDQVVPADPLMLMGAIDDTGLVPPAAPGGADRQNMPAGPMRQPALQWTRDEAAEAATPEHDVIFTFQTAAGLIWRKQWLLVSGTNRYDIVLRLSVAAAPGATAAPAEAACKLLAVSGHLREHTRGAFVTPNAMVYRLSDSADASDRHQDGLPLIELATKGVSQAKLRMLASRSSYFLTSYYGTGAANEPVIDHAWATGEQASLRPEMEEALARFYKTERGVDIAEDAHRDVKKRVAVGVQQMFHAWMALRVPVGAPQPVELKFYVGPLDRKVLAQDAYAALDPVISYPNAPDFVAKILMWIYDFWRSLFGSAGLAVILMTVCVRGAMMPISVRNQLSMRKYGRKVAKLKPKVKELQKRHANNPKKLREEQMKLYKQHGVGFPTGCLMMLIQIPVFFALFSALRVEYTIRGEHFLWIKDLSGPDRLVDFGRTVLNLGFFWVESINLLPLLMVTLSILHTRNMPKPADDQQAQQMKMMKWLPIIFAVILYNYTAALAIYMVLSSTVAIIESKIVRSKDDEDQAAPAAT